MNTTILIKTNKALKKEASRIAEELGIPLTTVINAYLGQFVRERKITLASQSLLSEVKLRELLGLSLEMDKGRNFGIRASNKEELFKHLDI
jgi:addiction module RelB/DinJ family antitoxin